MDRIEYIPLNEVEYKLKEDVFGVELLDINKLVKTNDIKEVSNPVFFSRDNHPTPDGLLSNEIFGITKADRGNTLAYIDLHQKFIHPLFYKVWCTLDSNVKACVYGNKKFIIKGGRLEESENGENGIPFLIKNIDSIKFEHTESNRRDLKLEFFEKNKKNTNAIFIDKYLVIPAYYRDVNTDTDGKVGVGEINQLYRNLLIAVRSIKGSSDFGLSLSAATRGRIQELLLQIYSWFGSGTTIGGQDTTNVLPGKTGLIRRAVLSKTADYSVRLVLSSPELKYERLEDIPVNLDYACLPLAALLVLFYPFNVFAIRRILDRNFKDQAEMVEGKNGKIEYIKIKNYEEQFSDEVIKKQVDRFITGYSNRFIPIEAEFEDGKKRRANFKGEVIQDESNLSTLGKDALVERHLTWCDIFFQACSETVVDKHVLITRYPIDKFYNQFPIKVKPNSTIETETIRIGPTVYKRYPKIREEDIGANTSNKFIDTGNVCNLFMDSIGGDYDGDTIIIKGIYSQEANDEVEKYINSPAYYVDMGGDPLKVTMKESILAMYGLTRVLASDKDKIQTPTF